jgi:xylulokinase
MAEVTVGIDIGTTAVKAVAADADGNIEARVRIPHHLIISAADRMEHDADEAWRQGPRRALAALVRPDARAVAVSAMVPSMTSVDPGGRPLTPGLLYGDGRGRRPGSSGGSPVESGEAVEFLRWTAAQAPEAAGYWSAPAVANQALGGEGVVDFGTAFTTNPLFNGEAWDEAVCADCHARIDQMPRVEMMGAPVGRLTDSQTVLAAGSIDALCEQLVAGADHDGDVLVLCGTTMIVWAVIPEAYQVPGLWTIPHTAPGKSMIGGASNAGGLFLNWAGGLLGPGDAAAADPGRVPVWSPYLRGERTPLHDPDRRAALDRLDITHDAAALRRAAFEASGFVARHLLDLAGVSPRRLVATGGGTRVDSWMQALADTTGLPVHVAAVPEGAALGAAFLARTAAGLESSMTDAARWAKTDRIIDPDPRWLEPVAERYARFRALADETRGE